MAGLNDFLTGTSTSATTLPSWYDTAQQNIVSQAQTAASQMPTLQNTVAGQAINNLSGANNPFTQAQNVMGNIATGAANPWITDTTTGQVTPNTATPLGGLFQAQNQQLNQLLPSTIAPIQAAAIGSGNFGSLRGQTAVDKAKADALANLQAQQMQAALTSQQTGVNAATGLSNIGKEGTATMMQAGQTQQAAPLTATADLAKIINSISAPATVTQSDQLSPLQQIMSLGNAAGTTVGGLNSLLGTLFPGSGTKGQAGYVAPASLGGLLQSAWRSMTGSQPTGTQTDSGLTQAEIDKIYADSGFTKNADGSYTPPAGWDSTDYPTDSNGNLQFDDAAQGTTDFPTDSSGELQFDQ